jgi:hypothetical protein
MSELWSQQLHRRSGLNISFTDASLDFIRPPKQALRRETTEFSSRSVVWATSRSGGPREAESFEWRGADLTRNGQGTGSRSR